MPLCTRELTTALLYGGRSVKQQSNLKWSNTMSTLYVFKNGQYVAKDWVKGNASRYTKVGYVVMPNIKMPIGSKL